jgi:hypothetical protein
MPCIATIFTVEEQAVPENMVVLYKGLYGLKSMSQHARTGILSHDCGKSGFVIRPSNIGLEEKVWTQNLLDRN